MSRCRCCWCCCPGTCASLASTSSWAQLLCPHAHTAPGRRSLGSDVDAASWNVEQSHSRPQHDPSRHPMRLRSRPTSLGVKPDSGGGPLTCPGGERKAGGPSKSEADELVVPGRATGGSGELVGAVGVRLLSGVCRAPDGGFLPCGGACFFSFCLRAAGDLPGRTTAAKDGTRGAGIDPALRFRPPMHLTSTKCPHNDTEQQFSSKGSTPNDRQREGRHPAKRIVVPLFRSAPLCCSLSLQLLWTIQQVRGHEFARGVDGPRNRLR